MFLVVYYDLVCVVIYWDFVWWGCFRWGGWMILFDVFGFLWDRDSIFVVVGCLKDLVLFEYKYMFVEFVFDVSVLECNLIIFLEV